MDLLQKVVAPAIRMALKLHQVSTLLIRTSLKPYERNSALRTRSPSLRDVHEGVCDSGTEHRGSPHAPDLPAQVALQSG